VTWISKTIKGWTPLHIALYSRQESIVKSLIDGCCSINNVLSEKELHPPFEELLYYSNDMKILQILTNTCGVTLNSKKQIISKGLSGWNRKFLKLRFKNGLQIIDLAENFFKTVATFSKIIIGVYFSSVSICHGLQSPPFFTNHPYNLPKHFL